MTRDDRLYREYLRIEMARLQLWPRYREAILFANRCVAAPQPAPKPRLATNR